MKKMNCLMTLLIVLINSFITGNVHGDAIQKTIHFQGFLTDSNNVAVMNGTYPMSFSLWDGPSDADINTKKLWEESVSISVSRGIYSVNLGETNPFPYTLNFAEQYYLGVQVGTDDIMKINGSLIPIVSTWHAFRADSAGGRTVKSVSQDYTLETTDDFILTTGSIAITLPSAANVPEKWYTIKKVDDDATTVTIGTSNGEQINNTNAVSISKQFIDLSIISNGLQW